MSQEGPPPAIAPESGDALPDITDEPTEAALREPAHQVSPRAVAFWRTSAAVGSAFQLGLAGSAYYFADQVLGSRPWYLAVLLGLLVASGLVRVVWMPQLRYRIHRWEITPTAVFTRSGWLSREQRIAPLSRVQTVDSHQGAVMRLFKLSSITVTTASAAGPVRIDCLDQDVARRVVAELTEITGSAEGDAT